MTTRVRAGHVRVGTELAAPADRVVAALRRVSTLRYVTRGALAVDGADGPLPAEWPLDDVGLRLRVRPLHLPVGWVHTIRVVEHDPRHGVLRTEEHGGPLRRWAHTLTVEPLRGDRSYYVDDVRFDAGILTPVVVVCAAVFYRWRQRRWRRLAPTL